MTITTQAQLDAARKFDVAIIKSPLSVNGSFDARVQPFAAAGNPPAGTLAAGDQVAGVVHTDATTGYPDIPSFGGLDGHIVGYTYAVSATNRGGWLYDVLFKAGAYTAGISVDQLLAGQLTTWENRVPGSDFKGLELHVECTTAMVGTAVITIDYEDENSNPQVATATLPLNLPINRIFRVSMPSVGIRKITRVRETGATSGAFNVVIARKLVSALKMYDQGASTGTAIPSYQFSDLQAGFVRIYEDSALLPVFDNATSARNGFFSLTIALG
jgi:hypothetical protein